jgi:hypothetical protein
VAGYGLVRATPAQLAALRQRPGSVTEGLLPPAFLKHADDQTVAGLTAVFQAMSEHGLAATRFEQWGVLAAPRFLGRATLTVALQRFALEGAWGISPHLIPHRSLHAPSGTVSQALQIHGPNFGVGGGPDSAVEAILQAVALLSTPGIPGVWVIITGWHPEPTPDRKGQYPPDSTCLALALALVPADDDEHRLRLKVFPETAASPEAPSAAVGADREPFQFETMLAQLETGGTLSKCWSLGAGLHLELEQSGAGNREGSAVDPGNGRQARGRQGGRIGAGAENQP